MNAMARRYMIIISAVIDHALTILIRNKRILPDTSQCIGLNVAGGIKYLTVDTNCA